MRRAACRQGDVLPGIKRLAQLHGEGVQFGFGWMLGEAGGANDPEVRMGLGVGELTGGGLMLTAGDDERWARPGVGEALGRCDH